MSDTYDKIQAEIKTAMRNGYTLVRDTLRMVVAEIKNKTVNEGKEITEDVVVSCLKKFAKQCEDSIASAESANRNDLVCKAQAELSVVADFLPKMLSETEQEALCKDLVEKSMPAYGVEPTKKNFGMLMKHIPSNCDKKFCAKILQGLLK